MFSKTPPDESDDATGEDNDEEEEELEDDGEVEDFADYDSDEDYAPKATTGGGSGVDPYAGMNKRLDSLNRNLLIYPLFRYILLQGSPRGSNRGRGTPRIRYYSGQR